MTRLSAPKPIDIESLIRPISELAPCGDDPREHFSDSNPYLHIRQARESARDCEKKWSVGLEAGSALTHWQEVLDLSCVFLQEHAKDLEVTAWLIEALTRIHGFKGLAAGFDLYRLLTEQYWGSLHPMSDPLSDCTITLAGLNGEDKAGVLINPIYNIPITQSPNHGPFCSWHYQQALNIDGLKDAQKRRQYIDDGGVSLQDFLQAVAQTPGEFYTELFKNIKLAQNNHQALSVQLDQLCGLEAPPLSQIKGALQNCLEYVDAVANDKVIPNTDATSSEEETPDDDKPKKAQGREHALAQIHEAALYFQQHEPHSPLPYILNRAVKWARTPLPELLQELIDDNNTLKGISSMTGIEINLN